MQEIELEIREAEERDAEPLLEFLNQVGKESDFLSLDQEGIAMTSEEMSLFIKRQSQSSNALYLVALIGDEIVGLVSVTSEKYFRVSHIGSLFIVIKKSYWNQGLGNILLEETILWSEEMSSLYRLELSVQVRNERAIHLYQKHGFEIEGRQKRGVRLSEGKFTDVYVMGRLIDGRNEYVRK